MNKLSIAKLLVPFAVMTGALTAPANAVRVDVSFSGNFNTDIHYATGTFSGSFWYESDMLADVSSPDGKIHYTNAIQDFTISGLKFDLDHQCKDGSATCIDAVQGDVSGNILVGGAAIGGTSVPSLEFDIYGQPNANSAVGDLLRIRFNLPVDFHDFMGYAALPATAAGVTSDLSNADVAYIFDRSRGSFGTLTSLVLAPAEAPAPAPAVPEPATWAMMIGGFGLVGGVMRRRKVVAKALA